MKVGAIINCVYIFSYYLMMQNERQEVHNVENSLFPPHPIITKP